MNKISKQFLLNLVLIFYVFSIILELHIFYNSISTLIRAVFISLIFLVIFFKYSNKKERKYLIFYFLLYGIFIILHLLNIHDNSILAEILYFYKMSMHVLTIYIVYKLGIRLENFYKILNICIWMICGSIVFCNLFKLGYSSYYFIDIEYNIFDWFKLEEYGYITGSGKGYFHFTNQIVAIILLYLPILINYVKEKTTWFNILSLIIAVLSLLILGNRLACYGPGIILLLALIIYVFFLLIKKEKLNLKFLITLIIMISVYGIVLMQSPVLQRSDFYNDVLENIPEKEENNQDENVNDKETEKNDSENDILVNREDFIYRVFENVVMNMSFPLIYYPYEYDVDFWQEMLKYGNNLLIDARFVELKIIQRVVELNDNQPNDMLLGIGYDRIMAIQNIEKDYIMQYYSVGLIGLVIMVGVYIIIYLYLLFKVFINLDDKLSYQNMLLLLGIGIVLASAYHSGNLLNAISVIIPLSFVLGIAVNEINYKYKKKDMILGFNVCPLEKKEILNNLFEDAKNKKQNIIYNINPLIVANFYKNDKIVKEFNKQNYNIPDGIGTIFASKMKDGNLKQRIAGVDLVYDICERAIKDRLKIYLYGSKPGIANKAQENLEKKYKSIKIVGTTHGYVKEKDALKEILKVNPDILFIALGSPKQEEFIIKNKRKLKNIKIIMPVGGSLDVISGEVKRAPKIWSKIHLEWLYRMIKEPKRIKQNIGIIKFAWLVIFRNNWYNKKRSGDSND